MDAPASAQNLTTSPQQNQIQSPRNLHQKRFSPIILLILVLPLAIGFGAYSLSTQRHSPFQTPNSEEKTSSSSNQNEKTPIADAITLSDYSVLDPAVIQQVYPTERVTIGGQTYNATQIITTAQLSIPVENDYSIYSSFDSVGSITAIDGKEGAAYESVFHLTRGKHTVEIKYTNGDCLDTEYLQKTYGTEAKQLTIYFAIRRKSDKQTIQNYTMFDNPLEIRANSKPLKKTDLYLHCS